MKEYRYYLLHSFLQNFTQYAFFIFGSLLIYEKTQSIGLTLVYYLLGGIASVLVKSVFVKSYLRVVKKIGVVRTIAQTMVIGAISVAGLYFVNIQGHGLILLMILGVIYSIANSCYWILSSTLYFNYSGISETPGKMTSYNFIATILASVTVSIVALVLHFDNNFLLLFIMMGLFLLASIIPLKFLTPPMVDPVSFKECSAQLSTAGFWSNINPEHTITTNGIPLIILGLFGSLSKSIDISIIVAIFTILLVYGAGKNKDRNSNRMLWPAIIIVSITAIIYGFIKTPIAFIYIGIIYNLAYSIIDAGRDTGLSREVSNSQNPLQTTVAIEFARSVGGLIGNVVLIGTYLIFHTVWQPVLILAVLFTIPRAFYALKNIRETNNVILVNI
jgi:hypothetical protein